MSNQLQPHSTKEIVVANNQIAIANNIMAISTRNEIKAFFLRHPMLFHKIRNNEFLKKIEVNNAENFHDENLGFEESMQWLFENKDKLGPEYTDTIHYYLEPIEWNINRKHKHFDSAATKYLRKLFDDENLKNNNQLLFSKISHFVSLIDGKCYPFRFNEYMWLNIPYILIAELLKCNYIIWSLALVFEMEGKFPFCFEWIDEEEPRGVRRKGEGNLNFRMNDIEELHKMGKLELQLGEKQCSFLIEKFGDSFFYWLSSSDMLTIELIARYRDKLSNYLLHNNQTLSNYAWSFELIKRLELEWCDSVLKSVGFQITKEILEYYYHQYKTDEGHFEPNLPENYLHFIHNGLQFNPNLLSNLDLVEEYSEMWFWNTYKDNFYGEVNGYPDSYQTNYGYSTWEQKSHLKKFPLTYSTIIRFRKQFHLNETFKHHSQLFKTQYRYYYVHYSENKHIAWTIDIVKLWEEEAEACRKFYKEEDFVDTFLSNESIWEKAFNPFVDEQFMNEIQNELASKQ